MAEYRSISAPARASYRGRWGILLAFLLLSSLAVIWITQSRAAATPLLVTFNVDSTLDLIDDDTGDGLCRTASNTCTLRAAVMQANAISGQGSQIILPPGTYTLTRPSAGDNGPDSGDLNLTTPESGNPRISFIGAGAIDTILDANGLDRVLTVEYEREAILTGVSLQNGYLETPSGQAGGGAIRNFGSLTLVGVTVRDNIVSGNPAVGGGIYNTGQLAIVGSSIIGNEATGLNPAGGGIANKGLDAVLSLSDSVLQDNKASFGGGIYNDFGHIVVNGSALVGNEGVNGGGAVYNIDGSADVFDTTVIDNEAASGGGLFNIRSSLRVVRSTIRLNRSTESLRSGGGLHNDSESLIVIEESTVSENQAYTGGGLYNEGNLFMINSTVSLNDAYITGGGIYNDGTANVYNSTIVFNQADADIDFIGETGGVYSRQGAQFNLRNTLLAGSYRSGAPEYDDCGGIIYSYGHNLIGVATLDGDSINCTVDQTFGTWDLLNSLSTAGDLLDNGGPTHTHALLEGSNAIDGGDPVGGCVDQNSVLLAIDQRGAPRVAGVSCDIGAYELGPEQDQPSLYLPVVIR